MIMNTINDNEYHIQEEYMTLKKALVFFVLICVAVSSVPLGVFAEGTSPVLTSSSDVLANVPPADYVENGPCPSGIPLGVNAKAMTENEFFVTENSSVPYGNFEISSIRNVTYDGMDEFLTGDVLEYVYPKSDSLALGGSMAFADAVAFDPYHTGKADYVAYVSNRLTPAGEHGNFEVMMYNQDYVAGSGTGARVSLFTDELCRDFNYLRLTYFYSIDAGNFSGDFVDMVAFTAQNMETDEDGTEYTDRIYIATVDDGDVLIHAALTVEDYLEYYTAFDYTTPYPAAQERPSFTVKCGDFDRDGLDELALISTSIGKHDTLHGASSAEFGNYTAEVAIIDDPLGEAECVYHEAVYDRITDTDKATVLYAARGATGEMNGDRADDLVLAGYVGTVTETSSGEYSNRFVPDTSKLGISMISYNGTDYVRTNIQTVSMNKYTRDGFYANDAVWQPLGVETAATDGFNAPATLFVSGTLYKYSDGEFAAIHTHSKFEDGRDSFASDAYVPTVKKGNVTHDPIGRQSFVFLMAQKTSKKDELSLKVGAVLTLDADGEAYFSSWSLQNIADKSAAAYNGLEVHAIGVSDCDNDGMTVKYVGTDYVYEDPEVTAVLQAAPYFKELGDWATFLSETSYEITTSYAKSSGGSKGFTLEPGFIVGTNGGFVTDVEQQLNVGEMNSRRSTWSDTYTTSYTTSFTAGPVDTVIIRRIPIEIFSYQVWDNEKGDWMVNDDGTPFYYNSLFKLKPTFYQLTLEEYNEFVEEYNYVLRNDPDAQLLYPIRCRADQDREDFVDALPVNSSGNPCNYYSSSTGVEIIGDTVFELGYTGGSTASAQDYCEEHSSGKTWETGVHINYSVTVSFGFDFFNVGGKIKGGGYLDFTYTWEGNSETIKGNGYGASGQVVNLNAQIYPAEDFEYCKRYGFRWNFARWEAVLAEGAAPVPVYGYILYGVRYPGQAPQNVEANLRGDYATVTITWETPADVGGSSRNRTGYSIYRQASDGARIKIGQVDANTFTFSDTYSSLARAKTYTYYVGCDYDDGGTYTAVSWDGSDIVGGLTGPVCGDANGDGIVSLSDVSLLQRYVAGMEVTVFPGADVNGDGAITVSDINILTRYLAGMIRTLG